MCERLRRRTRGFENHLEVFATGFGHSIAMSSGFEKDRWYLRPGSARGRSITIAVNISCFAWVHSLDELARESPGWRRVVGIRTEHFIYLNASK